MKYLADLLLILLIAITDFSSAADLPPVRVRRQPLVRLDTEIKGRREDGTIHAWVYFRDKGVDTRQFQVALQRVESRLTKRSIERRKKRGKGDNISFLDIPVRSEYIAEVVAAGAKIRQRSRWLNAVSVSCGMDNLETISKLPFVSNIDPVMKVQRKIPETFSDSQQEAGHPSRSVADSLDYGNSLSQLEQINCVMAHEAGFTGLGVLVLMLDTGYFKEHESIQQDSIVAEWDFINNDEETQNEESDPWGQHDHGTFTLSTLGGYAPGSLIGPAYQARFLLAKTEMVDQEIQVEEDNFVAALEWGDSLGADIASSSLGYLDWYTYEDMDGNTAVTTIGVDIAISLGIVCVTAAGNEGYYDWYYIIAPADADSVIAVGAVDSEGMIASFSSHGPTYDGRTKPEVCARGVYTFCASPSGTQEYTYVSGTSLSTPLVGGAAAVVLSAHPDWTPMQVREALMMTASQSDSPDNDYGWGIINVWDAINYESEPVLGDLNGDYMLNVTDVLLMVDFILDPDNMSVEEAALADMNHDQLVDVFDIILLIQIILGQ
ncbi:MAG: S8 family serine peptidase [Fidelibacterota bacterium]